MIDELALPDLRHAASHLDDCEYRKRFAKRDYVQLAPQQKAVLNCPERDLYLKAGSQTGKTHVDAFKVACEAVGRYPADYAGRRVPKPKIARAFDKVIWCISTTNLLIRDAAQSRLLGNVMTGHPAKG